METVREVTEAFGTAVEQAIATACSSLRESFPYPEQWPSLEARVRSEVESQVVEAVYERLFHHKPVFGDGHGWRGPAEDVLQGWDWFDFADTEVSR